MGGLVPGLLLLIILANLDESYILNINEMTTILFVSGMHRSSIVLPDLTQPAWVGVLLPPHECSPFRCPRCLWFGAGEHCQLWVVLFREEISAEPPRKHTS